MDSKVEKKKPGHKAGKKRKSDKRRIGIPAVIAIICGVLIVAAAIILLPFFTAKSPAAATIMIPRNASSAMVRDSLEKYFGAGYASRTLRVFDLMAKNPASRYGAYEIPKGASPFAVGRRLARGAQKEVKLTINGVREFDSFIPRIAAKFDFSADDFRKALANPETLRPYDLTPEQAPALFMNDTYLSYWNSTPQAVIAKVGENYLNFWNNERKAKAEKLGLTPAEVMIVASIVDEESNKADEKGKIGRLYINRLHKRMKLQADPTVRFALKDFTIRRVTQKHILSAPAPYNTYRSAGLPPGPIRTTSTRTVDAILNSAPSTDIYMCAREDFSGYHNFAATYEEHQQNARRYQKTLDERGIR